MGADLGGAAGGAGMSQEAGRPDVAAIMSRLKDFQRNTAEYAFRRLYTDPDPTRRFLVADEVGLGKTKVAQGVVAMTVDHLWDAVRRIDIIYICSNSEIAHQNLSRLGVPIPGQQPFTLASRITLLPTEVKQLGARRVNLIALTPSTSFDPKSSLGTAAERVLLYWLLDGAWDLKGTGPLNVLQGWVTDANRFRAHVGAFDRSAIDSDLAQQFAHDLEQHAAADRAAGRADLHARFDDLCDRFRYARRVGNIPEKDRIDRARLVGELRALLAATCLKALQPDLIILDEFQRFKHLLSGESDSSRLARELFTYSDETTQARVLLLSATPYKMYTLHSESGEDNHYRDFADTLAFLEGGQSGESSMEPLLSQYRRQLYRLGDEGGEALSRLRKLKAELEGRLRRVMVRTERLAVSADRSGMLVQVPPTDVDLMPQDLQGYLAVQKVAEVLGQGDMLGYWKSSPYLLNFMESYELKRALWEQLALPVKQEAVAGALLAYPEAQLPWSEWKAYRRLDPGNARLRSLQQATVGAGMWRLLWMPPSLPYYRLAGPFAGAVSERCTKRLIFSAWQVVPKAIATLLSYEAERLTITSHEPGAENTPEARRRRRPLLRFAHTDNRLTGMPILGMLYPSAALAAWADPLSLAGCAVRDGGGPPSLETALSQAEDLIRPHLQALPAYREASGPEDEGWYWAAPILLDLQENGEQVRTWFADAQLAPSWSGAPDDAEEDGESNWAAHVDQARELVAGRLKLGSPPSDLTHVLALMALAGPGIAVLRTFSRLVPPSGVESLIRHGAGHIAWALRSLFNLPEVTALLRGLNGAEPYWRRVLEYCAAGCLQAALDEYAHVLLDAEGLRGKAPEVLLDGLTTAMADALTLRTVTLWADDLRVEADRVVEETVGMRARFALRYGSEQGDDKRVTRHTQVQNAFNSPFWPFVLASTSIGQEGLDFHPYCHAVVHWDLPHNPVDMEQREGRVHRYKGHAVRKNLARVHMAETLGLMPQGGIAPDPWEKVFDAGIAARPPGSSDLVPFWVYPIEDGACIERHVPYLPLSQDEERLQALRRSLAVYRVVFGQPRQEDVVSFLLDHMPEEQVRAVLADLQIDLAPPAL